MSEGERELLDEPGTWSWMNLVHVRAERELDEPGGKSEQLEDRSVGRCATTTESEGAANPWERGIVEKELVKKDYRTVLEAWWTR